MAFTLQVLIIHYPDATPVFPHDDTDRVVEMSDGHGSSTSVQLWPYEGGFYAAPASSVQRLLRTIPADGLVYFSLQDTIKEHRIYGFANDGTTDRITYDADACRLVVDQIPVELHRTEVRAFDILARHAGRVIEDARFFSHLWPDPDSAPDDPANAARILLVRLRNKLGKELRDPKQGAIRRIRSVGNMAVTHL